MHVKNTIGIPQLNLAALEKLMESLKQWADIAADNKMSVTDFYEILLFVGQQVTFSRKNPSKFGVQVFPFRQTSVKPYKILYVMGMEDGVFPGSESTHFAHLQYFPGRLRPFLVDEDLYKDRELLLLMLQYPADLIRFSYPKTDKDRPILPSVFLRELARISGDNLEIAAAQTLITRTDILESLAFPKNLQQQEKSELSEGDDSLRPFIDENQLERLKFSQSVVEIRENVRTDSRWEGTLTEEAIVTGFTGSLFSEKAFSPTELERFAYCPMIYFFERLLGVESADEVDVFLSRLDRGQIVHNILYRFYAEHPETQRNLEKLLEISEQELRKIPLASGLFRDFEFEYFLGSEDVEGLMKAFWEYEQQILPAYPTYPRHFEFSFGGSARMRENTDPASTKQPLQIDSYQFRGKVDRIEIADDGSLLVVDYKTGAYPSVRDMWEGERLQLPLYLQAVYQILHEKYPNLKMAGAAFYSLRNANDIEKKIAFADQHFAPEGQKISAISRFPNTVLGESGKSLSLEEFLEHVIQQAGGYIDRIREGEFRHTTDPGHCSSWDGSSCPYRAICKLNSFKQAILNREASGKL